MTAHFSELGLPIGPPVLDWKPRPLPPRTPMEGRFCRLEAVDIERHAAELHDAFSLDTDARHWTYLPFGPFPTSDAYTRWLGERAVTPDTLLHAIIDRSTGRAVGTAALKRIDPANGAAEIGLIRYAVLLQKKPAATEAIYLLLRRIFDELGYRRCEWNCDSFNAPSRRAAERYGFIYEGTFRQAAVYRGRSRDTVWLSIIDSEWPALKRAFELWLAAENFDAQGRQRKSLIELRTAIL